MTAAVAFASLSARYTEEDLGSDYDDDDDSEPDHTETTLYAKSSGPYVFDDTPDDTSDLLFLFDGGSGEGTAAPPKTEHVVGESDEDGESNESDTAKNRSHDAEADNLSSPSKDSPAHASTATEKDEDIPVQAQP
jgi:hypothetical protein